MKRSLLILASLLLSACGGESGAPNAEKLNTPLLGFWKVTEGDLFTSSDQGSLAYLALDEEGAAVFYRVVGDTGITFCEPSFYDVTSDQSIFFDRSEAAMFGLTQYLVYTLDGDTLSLAMAGESGTRLTRVAEIPAANLCTVLEAAGRFSVDLQPDSRAEIAYDGTNLWFTLYDGPAYLQPVDPATGSPGTAVVPPSEIDNSPTFILAAQGTDLWLSTGAGDNNPVSRVRLSPLSIVDRFDTADPPIEDWIDVGSAAFDGTFLWIFGLNRDTGTSKFLKVRPDLGSPVLVDSIEFPGVVRGVASDGGSYLWILATSGMTGYLAKMDPATMTAVSMYQLPESETEFWYGLTVVGSSLVVAADDQSTYPGKLVLYTFNP